MRTLIVAMFLMLSGVAGAAKYPCPPPLSEASVACTLASPGGTTTYTASVTASANGSSEVGSAIALFMTLDGSACNDNFNVPVLIAPSALSVNVSGTCTFEVTSDRLVNLFAFAQSQNSTSASISLVVTSVAFVPDSILTVSRVGSGSVASSDNRINCGFDCWESYAFNSTVTLFAEAAQGWTFGGWGGNCGGTAKSCVLTMSAARNVTAYFAIANLPPVVEFYNSLLGHFFVTADAAEAAAIDIGSAGPGWLRTGLTFKPGGDTPVCRFYGSVSPGPNSHFYTAFAAECAALQQLQVTTPDSQPRWNYENIAFATTLPLNGTCASGTIPVYRAYNNGLTLGKESNHRFTTSLFALNEVIARGWKNEGVAMCAPE
ncbi:MAG: hypothetical protein ABIS68_10220 [Casimicrobiaceae bacterium]